MPTRWIRTPPPRPPVNYFLIDTGSTTGTQASGTAIALTAATTDAQVEDMIRVVDSMLTQMTDAASNLGAVNKRDLHAG
jgi:flagellin